MPRCLSLLVDLYELTMAQCYFRYKKDTQASFDLFVRELPQNRSYLIAAGLEDILNYIRTLNFGNEDIAYLEELKIFSSDFLKFLSGLKFSGDIWAMPEGTVFFPNEPVIRVTAPIIQAQLIESFLLNTINLQTMIASKASRVVQAAQGKAVYDFALRRTHGQDAGIKVSRSSYLVGFAGTSNVLAGKTYKIPIAGTMAHSFVMSFKNELDSFLAYSRTFPAKTILLVDTYDVKKAIQNAIRVGLELKKKGFRLLGIRLDSGNIVSLSKLARKMLDDAGLRYVEIFASGNLDEFRIKDILKSGGCCDSFGVGTHMGASVDAPALDAIYKLCEVSDENGGFLPTMKLSKGKVTYPGRKQVFRIEDKRGNFIRDVLALEKEKIDGKPLLLKVVEEGKPVYELPSLEKIRKYALTSLMKFPEPLKEVSAKYRYPVLVSSGLKKLIQKLSRRLSVGQ
jgi:nicotinate phosphoribosyltransferase